MARNGDARDPIEQAFLNAYPNPQRIGCPTKEILSKIAHKQLPVESSDLEHVTQCSPCFKDIKAFQAAWQSAQSRRRFAAVAAALALVSAGSVYLLVRQPWKLDSTPSIAHSKALPPVTEVPPKSIETAVLNFETLSGERGAFPGLNRAAELQRLPQNQLSLSIYLPKGSEPGKYQVRLLKAKSDQVALVEAEGTARIETGLTVLLLTVDFSHLKPGTYAIAFRRESGAWHYSNVVVS